MPLQTFDKRYEMLRATNTPIRRFLLAEYNRFFDGTIIKNSSRLMTDEGSVSGNTNKPKMLNTFVHKFFTFRLRVAGLRVNGTRNSVEGLSITVCTLSVTRSFCNHAGEFCLHVAGWTSSIRDSALHRWDAIMLHS